MVSRHWQPPDGMIYVAISVKCGPETVQSQSIYVNPKDLRLPTHEKEVENARQCVNAN